MSKPLFIGLLYSSPVFPEVLIIDEFEKSLQSGEVLKPHVLIYEQGLANELAEARIALISMI